MKKLISLVFLLIIFFNINAQTSIVIGTTPFISGTDTRLLFQNNNKAAQSSNLTFNNSTNALTIGGTINKLTLTAPASAATLTLANNSSLITSGAFSTTFTSTGTTTLTLPTSGTLATTSNLSSYVPTTRTLTINGTTSDLSSNRTWTVGDALVTNPLSQFASTTSSQLASVLSDETGSGALVFGTSPSFTTPILGTPTSGLLSSCTGLPLTTGITGTLGITNGGTGQTTTNTAFNALAPNQTSNSGKYLTTDGTNTSWGTISTGLTINSTAITSGTSGRLLFENSSNQISESANLFWDNTNNLLGIGGTTPGAHIHLSGNISATAWSTGGIVTRKDAATYTDNSTAAAGSINDRTASSDGVPTFASTNAITVRRAYNLLLQTPIAGTNTTFSADGGGNPNAFPLGITNGTHFMGMYVDNAGITIEQFTGGANVSDQKIIFRGSSTTQMSLSASGGSGESKILASTSGGGGAIGFNTSGVLTLYTGGIVAQTLSTTGKTFVGGTTVATAYLHLTAGTASVNTAPLKFTSGTNLSTTEAGTVEYNGTHLYFTATNAGTRYQLDNQAIAGSVSQTGTATTTFTVTIGATQANSTYKVNVTPTDLLAAAAFYVTNKTTTTFDVAYLAGLTGVVTFDWSLFP